MRRQRGVIRGRGIGISSPVKPSNTTALITYTPPIITNQEEARENPKGERRIIGSSSTVKPNYTAQMIAYILLTAPRSYQPGITHISRYFVSQIGISHLPYLCFLLQTGSRASLGLAPSCPSRWFPCLHPSMSLPR